MHQSCRRRRTTRRRLLNLPRKVRARSAGTARQLSCALPQGALAPVPSAATRRRPTRTLDRADQGLASASISEWTRSAEPRVDRRRCR
jgi:hypothetical protein